MDPPEPAAGGGGGDRKAAPFWREVQDFFDEQRKDTDWWGGNPCVAAWPTAARQGCRTARDVRPVSVRLGRECEVGSVSGAVAVEDRLDDAAHDEDGVRLAR
eukprot:SAG22_NODE_1452_length_4395_cov_2.925745_1_plen_102_part_00